MSKKPRPAIAAIRPTRCCSQTGNRDSPPTGAQNGAKGHDSRLFSGENEIGGEFPPGNRGTLHSRYPYPPRMNRFGARIAIAIRTTIRSKTTSNRVPSQKKYFPN